MGFQSCLCHFGLLIKGESVPVMCVLSWIISVTDTMNVIDCLLLDLIMGKHSILGNRTSRRNRVFFFAGSRAYGFHGAKGSHLINSGGLLHLKESSRSTVHIFPFWQMGQTVTSIPQILRSCSCQVSRLFSFVAFLTPPIILWHNAILSWRFLFARRPTWRIRT